MKPGQYICAACGGTFDKGWTDAEKLAEKEIFFGKLPLEECETVCYDCYNRIMRAAAEEN